VLLMESTGGNDVADLDIDQSKAVYRGEKKLGIAWAARKVPKDSSMMSWIDNG